VNPNYADKVTDCAGSDDNQGQLADLKIQLSEVMEQNQNLRQLDGVLRRTTALFEAVLANCSEGITLTGPDRRIVRVIKGLTGLDPHERTGSQIDALAIPEDRAIIKNCYERLFQDGRRSAQCEVRIRRADGALARFSIKITDMLDDPNVQCIVLNYADVTARSSCET
jgi:PAS domain S-box-containing protein